MRDAFLMSSMMAGMSGGTTAIFATELFSRTNIADNGSVPISDQGMFSVFSFLQKKITNTHSYANKLQKTRTYKIN